ncbi:MAG TPA: hypothetical protein VGX02_07915 [Candidatus Eremiobacteraceae bacterium]|nr:hypothetical protein [Candidatus Eremiobacteraceae bacterium]
MSPQSTSWNEFGDHGDGCMRCPLFKTDTMCAACCEHFTMDLFTGNGVESAFDDAYTRFRLTARREITKSAFRTIATYACRRCPNNPMRGAAEAERRSNID